MAFLIKNIARLSNYALSVNTVHKDINKLVLCSIHRAFSFVYDEKDPAPLFFDEEIQKYLKTLTRVDLNKVYRRRKLQERWLETPEYKFMTTKQLDNLMKEIQSKADEKLQMPPVIQLRKPIDKVLSKDPALKSYDTAKYVFTDISYGVTDRQRLIVTREPDGTLRQSEWTVRERMNEIYFPKPGREINVPRMFHDEYLKDLLARKEYEFVLDAACAQFEPDAELYQHVTQLTYQHINKNKEFDALRSTRHFGPFVFYLAWANDIDYLLLELLEHKKIHEIDNLLKLYYRIRNEDISDIQTCQQLIQKYINDASKLRSVLQDVFNEYTNSLRNEAVSI